MSGSRHRERDRKELINQLLMTRGVLLDELQEQERSGMISRRRPTTNSSSAGDGHLRLPKIGTTTKSQYEDYSPSNPSNMVLAYPLSHFNTKRRTAVKLPIFRLPPAGVVTPSPTKDIGRVLTTGKKDRNSIVSSNVAVRKFVAYHDKRNMRKTLVLLVNQLTAEEKEKLANTLNIYPSDIEDCINLMKDRFVDLGNQTMSGERTLVADIFPVDESMTVFNTAQHRLDVIKQQIHQQNMTQQLLDRQQKPQQQQASSYGGDAKHFQVDSIRAISRGVDFQKVGISSQFQEFLTSERINTAKMVPANPLGQPMWSRADSPLQSQTVSYHSPYGLNVDLRRQNSLPALGQTHADAQTKKSGGGMKKKKSGGQSKQTNGDNVDALLSSSDPKALSKAFLTSLLAVQKHSSLVKRSLETAQTMVTIEDTRAKELVFMLGAERMQKAIAGLILSEQRRGWIAWRAYCQQQQRMLRVHRLLRTLVVRNIIVALQLLVRRILQRQLNTWKHFTAMEVQRMRKERVWRATVLIQSCMRRYLAHKRVKLLKQRRKYEKVYDATVKLQAIFRSKVQRWRYLRLRRAHIEANSASLIQRYYRGWQARRRVQQIRLRRNRHHAATMIGKIVRAKAARRRVQEMREEQRLNRAAIRLQAMVRGFVTRRTLARVLVERARYAAAVTIQRRVRGMVSRKTLHRKIAEINFYRAQRTKMAVRIQAAYRGYHDRILVKIKLKQQRKERLVKFAAATKITTMVRGFLARRLLQTLRLQRFQLWLTMAREWQETWSDEGNAWCYIHTETGEALWEPTRSGYTRADGRLVLYSGDIVEDPRNSNKNGNDENGGSDGQDSLQRLLQMADTAPAPGTKTAAGKGKKAWLSAALCTECNDRTAIRHCHECNDQFCTKCYKATHALGARRHHTYDNLGPKDCDECELLLAERYCVTCDENFCDGCWRQLHRHGKRIYHPYCEISREGRVDTRIFTMDGDEVTNTMDDSTTYAQTRVDNQRTLREAQQVSAQIAQYNYADDTSGTQQDGYYDNSYDANSGGGYELTAFDPNAVADGGDDEWQPYQDEQGYTYYYNSYTGESTYDVPPSFQQAQEQYY